MRITIRQTQHLQVRFSGNSAEGMLDTFDITVICVVPSYLGTIEDKYKTQKYYEENINGVKILRIRVPEFSKTNKMSRIKNIPRIFLWCNGSYF